MNTLEDVLEWAISNDTSKVFGGYFQNDDAWGYHITIRDKLLNYAYDKNLGIPHFIESSSIEAGLRHMIERRGLGWQSWLDFGVYRAIVHEPGYKYTSADPTEERRGVGAHDKEPAIALAIALKNYIEFYDSKKTDNKGGSDGKIE